MYALKNYFYYSLLIAVMFKGIYAHSQENTKRDSPICTEELYQNLLEVRSYLHANPELSGEEKITASFIQKYLLDLGLEVKSNIGGYGVVGILHGFKIGKRIAWRADIDAIPAHVKTEDKLEDTTQKSSHHCGHDIHTTIGLGLASALSDKKDEIEGTIYFIFQPSEENYQGAKSMIADGLFDMIHPDEIYAAHVSPMPVGLIATKPDYLFADYKQINLTFEKVENSSSLLKFAKECISEIQNVAPAGEFWQMQNLMHPDIGIGSPNTIFKDYITVEDNFEVVENSNEIRVSGYLSASTNELIQGIPERLTAKIATSSYSNELKKVEFKSDKFVYSNDRGNVTNDSTLVNKALNALSAIPDKSITALPLYGVMPDGRGDDFAYFQQEVPGVYFFIGGSNFEKGIVSMPHAPNFKVDEKVIKVGVEAFSSLILNRMQEE
ncbi:M20 family metallopeptidase [Maribacter chungangensis]|uniref:M20 family metallopeptidase n=1 Tax=Maribacter chungangensis TaxID=1069117 RepID=A0ABW3B6W9_9FLAO